MPLGWLSDWEEAPGAFACARHRDAHDFDVAFSIAKLLDTPRARVLDFGCGEATRAQFVANRCERLYLWEGLPDLRRSLRQRHGEHPSIVVLDDDWSQAIEPDSLDLVVLNSVVPHVARDDFEHLLKALRPYLKPHARLLISDVIPPGVGTVADTWELLKYSRREGFLPQALRTVVLARRPDRTRRTLSKYSAVAFVEILKDHGFDARRLERNVGHNQKRMAFLAEPRSAYPLRRSRIAATAR